MPDYVGEIERPAHVDVKLKDRDGAAAGTLRIKPSTLLYKAPRARKWKSVTMDEVQTFITENGNDVSR